MCIGMQIADCWRVSSKGNLRQRVVTTSRDITDTCNEDMIGNRSAPVQVKRTVLVDEHIFVRNGYDMFAGPDLGKP